MSPPSPSTEPDVWPERRNGVLIVLALHLAFTAATWGVQAVAGGETSSGQTLLGIWVSWLGLLQSIYVIPAVLSAALMQRYQMMAGMIAAVVVTGLASLIGALIG